MSARLFRNFSLVNPEFTGEHASMAMIVRKGLIEWIGPQAKIPRSHRYTSETDLKKKRVLPSFIECHTHSVFAGSRAEEFEMRNQGVSYLEIAKRGGGILSTMKATRRASPAELLKSTQRRVDNFVRQGVSTIEIKSG